MDPEDADRESSPEVEDDDEARYQELFKSFDRDGLGSVDPADLGDALRQLGCNPTDDEVDTMIRDVTDGGKVNDDGRLEFDEFCKAITKNRKSLEEEEEELRAAFRLFDKNGDGTIDREELKQNLAQIGMWKGMTEEELDELMDAADTDHSGRIEYNELVRVMVGH